MALGSLTEIDLDLNQPLLTPVHAKQYDTVRKVKAHLFDHGVWWMVPENDIVAVVGFKKADKIGGFYDTTEDGITAVTVDGTNRSIVYIALDRNVLTTKGLVSVEITFYDSITTSRLSTFSFTVRVEEASLTELDLASNPYFNVLAEDIAAVLNAKASMKGLTARANGLPAGSIPTAVVNGGPDENPPTPYELVFGIPKGDKGNGIKANEIKYAANDDPATIPGQNEWQSSITAVTVPEENGVVWTRVKQTYDDNSSKTYYSKAMQGYVGPAGVAVQTTDPGSDSNVKVWINPDDGQIINIPDASECNPIHFHVAVDAFPKTIPDSRLTSQMRVINCVFSEPARISGNLLWSTETAGQLVLSGATLSGSGSTYIDLDVQVCVT